MLVFKRYEITWISVRKRKIVKGLNICKWYYSTLNNVLNRLGNGLFYQKKNISMNETYCMLHENTICASCDYTMLQFPKLYSRFWYKYFHFGLCQRTVDDQVMYDRITWINIHPHFHLQTFTTLFLPLMTPFTYSTVYTQ